MSGKANQHYIPRASVSNLLRIHRRIDGVEDLTRGISITGQSPVNYSDPFRPKPSPQPSPKGRGSQSVQTGNIVYRINRAHGLHCVGKEEVADAVEGNQCHGPKDSIDG